MKGMESGRSRTRAESCGSPSSASSSSSSSSTPFSSRSESIDAGDHPPMSEWEEIPSPRWMPPFLRSSPYHGRRDAKARPAMVADPWQEQLPPDYKDIQTRAVVPVRFSSFEDLYARLCNPILIDQGGKSFTLERSTGNKCYMLSVSQLNIAWGSGPRFLFHEPMPASRFATTADQTPSLGCSFRIAGRIHMRALSPGTIYAAYLVFKISSEVFYQGSLDASVAVGGRTFERTLWLEPEWTIKGYYEASRSVADRMWKMPDDLADVDGEQTAPVVASKQRADGWMEVELGEFLVGGEGTARGVVEVKVEDTRGVNRRGVIVEGIDFRPTHPSASGDAV